MKQQQQQQTGISNNTDTPVSTPKSNGTSTGYEVVRSHKPMKIRIQREYDHPNSKVIAIRGKHGFNGVQDDMEREMERRKMDWEKEVGFAFSQWHTFLGLET